MRMKCAPLSSWLSSNHNKLFVDLLNQIQNSNCLYVGLRHDSCDYWYDILLDNDNKIDILEIFQPNVDYLKTLDSWNIIQGDVTTYNIEQYDCLFWVQGPEHVSEDVLEKLLPRIAKLKHYYLSAPDSDLKGQNVQQGIMFNNKHEVHVSILNKEFFMKFFPEDQIILSDNCVIIRK